MDINEKDQKILTLFKSKNREDVRLAIMLVFTRYPEIRKYEKSWVGTKKMIVDYEDILHIVPWINEAGAKGMVTPEYWDNE